ncbi:hypothetical protein ACLOJK_005873 [Asimina triloba]
MRSTSFEAIAYADPRGGVEAATLDCHADAQLHPTKPTPSPPSHRFQINCVFMSSFNTFYSQSQSASPSAPPLPDSHSDSGHRPPSFHGPPGGHFGQSPPPTSSFHSGYSSFPSHGGFFPPGTHPDIVRSFHAVDRDRSGFIDETELQSALSTGYQKFSFRTIRLLMFLFKNPNDPSSRIGKENNYCSASFLFLDYICSDRSGEIDPTELRDALYSLGYAIPPSVLQVLISKYEDRNGHRGALNFDSFVECGMIVKVEERICP